MTHLYEENPSDLCPYSRREAFDDGLLIDLTDLDVCKAFYSYPIACTPAVWLIVEHGARDPLCLNTLDSIVSDILHAARQSSIDDVSSSDRVDFSVEICDRGALVTHSMCLVFGRDDFGDGCLTLLFLSECTP